MKRKKWSTQTEITPTLVKSREKRKWQIAFRRYVLERNPCASYAPYFGLDIDTLRKWLECQFTDGIGWDGFGKDWQFEHTIPVTYFDFEVEAELKMCWSFTNIRVGLVADRSKQSASADLLLAKRYFEDLYVATGYSVCQQLLDKIDQIGIAEKPVTDRQQAFLKSNRDYLEVLGSYSKFEFELLNSGRSMEEVKRETEFLKKYE